MTDVALALLQGGGYSGTGIFRFFAGLILILSIYASAWGFTYWISKDE